MQTVKISNTLSVLFDAKGTAVSLIQADAYISKKNAQKAYASLDMWTLEPKALAQQVAKKDAEIKARVAVAAKAPEVTDE